jgi:DNA-binding transcriptional regulator LsrR (DeoR family)
MKGLMADRDTMIKVCKLYYLEDLTQSEIAKLVGISASSAQVTHKSQERGDREDRNRFGKPGKF